MLPKFSCYNNGLLFRNVTETQYTPFGLNKMIITLSCRFKMPAAMDGCSQTGKQFHSQHHFLERRLAGLFYVYYKVIPTRRHLDSQVSNATLKLFQMPRFRPDQNATCSCRMYFRVRSNHDTNTPKYLVHCRVSSQPCILLSWSSSLSRVNKVLRDKCFAICIQGLHYLSFSQLLLLSSNLSKHVFRFTGGQRNKSMSALKRTLVLKLTSSDSTHSLQVYKLRFDVFSII